jgi:hypothetical protein
MAGESPDGELMDAAPPARALNPLVLKAVYDSWDLLRQQ